MRGVIWLVLLFVAAVVAATTLGTNDGMVTIYWSGWRTELSLNLFVLIVVGACVLVMAASQAFNSLISLPRRAGEWRALNRERAAQAALREAQSEYFSARYSRAHKAARKALALQQEVPELRADGGFSVLGHLLAAGSLHRLQDRTRRDELLRALERSTTAGRPADDGARLLAAEWALDDRDAPRALALLAELPPGVARRTQALRLRLQAARMARQPIDALHTARLLANHQRTICSNSSGCGTCSTAPTVATLMWPRAPRCAPPGWARPKRAGCGCAPSGTAWPNWAETSASRWRWRRWMSSPASAPTGCRGWKARSTRSATSPPSPPQ
jgi:HemY protein